MKQSWNVMLNRKRKVCSKYLGKSKRRWQKRKGRKILGSDNLLQAGQGTRRYGQAETDRGKDTGSAEGVVTGLPVS